MKIPFFNSKIVIILAIAMICSYSTNAQDLGIPFQGIAKDYAHNLVNQRVVYLELAIVAKDQPTAILFNELHKTKTDDWGLFSLQIGKGKWIGGRHASLTQINWASGNHQLQIKMAIEPEAPLPSWDYSQHLISLGNSSFGVVPYALYSFSATSAESNLLDKIIGKLNITDTANMLSNYAKQIAIKNIQDSLQKKLSILDTASMLSNYTRKSSLADYATRTSLDVTRTNLDATNNLLFSKLNIADSIQLYVTPTQLNANKVDTSSLSNRINLKLNLVDTIFMSNRIATKELLANKSTNMNAVADYTDQMYPSVKAAKDYIDNQVSMGAADASINNKGIVQLTGDLTGTATNPQITANAITTNKLADAAITDAKIASGIQASKVGLGNLTNNAQLYNLNGLTAQVQSFMIILM